MSTDTSSYERDMLIAVGVLAGVGFVLALVRTWAWQSRSGKDIIDIITILKFILFLCGILGSVLFIVTASVSLWLRIVSDV
ncbi:unnamed protein product [Didymodactylos carnosus]|uniref:Uncharacterized protein n=1 Tax=Didymodactylos carnosus TaxID=1234261 RepID=A0A8S2TWU2_9BILA|nr:unnamed protein product [Didymodactylos carnosus]CAF4313035.1 unnamed protein product [Didymodactylos carnosus]